MKIHVQKDQFVAIPTSGLDDTELSLAAKGLYALIFSFGKHFDYDTLLQSVKNEKELDSVLQELITAGYIVTTSTNEMYVTSSVKREENVSQKSNNTQKSTTGLTEEEKIRAAVHDYTDDDTLRSILVKYFNARLNPEPDSRFAKANALTLYTVNNLLSSLDECKGDKAQIVKTCLEKQYYKFFDLPSSTPIDGVVSNSYTEADIKELEQRRQSFEAQYGDQF